MGNVEKIIAEIILEMMQLGTKVDCIRVGFPSEITQRTYNRLKQEGRLDDPTC